MTSQQAAEKLRRLIIKVAFRAKAGHITSSLSAVDIMAVLYYGEILRHDVNRPTWEKRDRFILSKAHAGLGYYSLLAMRGFFSTELLKEYCKPGQHMGDHISAINPGVENSGGSLGHGLGIAAGMAFSSKLKGDDRLFYVLTGDGECQEGSIWESALMIGNKKINNLVWIIDRNGLQANGAVDSVNTLESLSRKLEAFGFEVIEADGHNHSELRNALYIDRSNLPKSPRAVIANTVKGYGIPFFAGKENWHGRQPNVDEYKNIAQELGMDMKELENF